MPMNLVLVRHGQSEGNVAVKAAKAGDDQHVLHPEFRKRHSSLWRLTNKGIEEARTTGQWLKENGLAHFDRYYTSAYLRAMETASYLELPDAKWYIEARLREREWGQEDLVSSEERKLLQESAFQKQENPYYWKPLNGESMADACMRVRDLMETLHRETDEKQVIVVCHGEIMEAFQIEIERWIPAQYKQHIQSEGTKNKIHNGQVIQYSRQNPHNPQEVYPYLNYKRSISPWDLSLCDPQWQQIQRKGFSNKDLLFLAEETQRIIE